MYFLLILFFIGINGENECQDRKSEECKMKTSIGYMCIWDPIEKLCKEDMQYCVGLGKNTVRRDEIPQQKCYNAPECFWLDGHCLPESFHHCGQLHDTEKCSDYGKPCIWYNNACMHASIYCQKRFELTGICDIDGKCLQIVNGHEYACTNNEDSCQQHACGQSYHCIWHKNVCMRQELFCYKIQPSNAYTCNKHSPCQWNSKKLKCLFTEPTFSDEYLRVKIGLDDAYLFDQAERCWIVNKRPNEIVKYDYIMITADVEKEPEVPTCFKDFHDMALLPICGHPLYDTFKYCQIGAFYQNKDYDKFNAKDAGGGNSLLFLLDGCLFCKHDEIGLFRDGDLKFGIEIEGADLAFDISHINEEGNFLLGFRLNNLVKPANVSFIIRHRCNEFRDLQFKTILIPVQPASSYPMRVWESTKTAIGLEQKEYAVEVKFNELAGKKDL